MFSKQQLPPNVRIWDSVTLNTLHVIGIGFFDRAVTCIAFSKSVSTSPVGIAASVHREERISSRLKRERVNTPVTAQVYVQIWTLKPPASQVPSFRGRTRRLGDTRSQSDVSTVARRGPAATVSSGSWSSLACSGLEFPLPVCAVPSRPGSLPGHKQGQDGPRGLPASSGYARSTEPPFKALVQPVQKHACVHINTPRASPPVPPPLVRPCGNLVIAQRRPVPWSRRCLLLQGGGSAAPRRLVLTEPVVKRTPRPLPPAPVPCHPTSPCSHCLCARVISGSRRWWVNIL